MNGPVDFDHVDRRQTQGVPTLTNPTPSEAWPFPWTLGDRLRKARVNAGYTALTFAATIGVSRESIRKYERDITVPRLPTLIAWAHATGCTVPQLLGTTHQATENPCQP